MRNYLLPILLTGIGAIACSGSDEPDPIIPDGPPAPRNVDPIPGGGTSGGPIADVLTVFVQDADKAAVADATVLVIHKGEEIKLSTDAAGRVDFYKKGLDSSLSMHIFKAGFEFTSVFGANASVVTINLDDGVDAVPADPKVGTVTGTITGWDNLAPNDGNNAARVVNIGAIGIDAADVAQLPRPGTVTPGDPDGTEHNVVINGEGAFPMWTDYALQADTRIDTVFAIGGLFNIQAGTFEVSHMGVQRNVALTEGGTVQANVDVSHALDQMANLTAAGLPALDEQRAIFGLRFEDDGALLPVAFTGLAMGNAASANFPALTGDLQDAVYVAGVQASSTEMVGDEPAKVAFAITTGTGLSYAFDAILAPPAAPTATGRMIGTMAVAGASFHSFEIRDETDARSMWNVVVISGAPTVELPTVPAGMTDPLSGNVILNAAVIDIGDKDINDIRFEDLQDAVVSSAASRAALSL